MYQVAQKIVFLKQMLEIGGLFLHSYYAARKAATTQVS
jgi:hypothetical protein